MRQFLLGILATVIGGTLLFVVTNWYTGWANSEQYQVEFQAEPAAGFIGHSELKAISDMLNKKGFNSGKVGIVRIENKSEQDIRNAKFVIAPADVNLTSTNLHGFGLASHISGEMPDPRISLAEDGIHVDYPVLKGHNGSYFWILHEPAQGFRVFSDQKPIQLKEFSKWDDQTSGLDFFFVFLIALGFLIVGLWGGNSLAQHVVKKAGYDPEKINAEYYRQLAVDAENKRAEKNQDRGA